MAAEESRIQALADQMGARISVNSADGLTTFSLTFPVRA